MEDNVSKAIDIVKEFNDVEWSNFLRAVRKYVKNEKRYYDNPITTNDDASELQELLMQTAINFIKEKGLIDIDDISFSTDGLKESIDYGKWVPSTDSYLALYGKQINENGQYYIKKLITEIM